MSISPIVSAAVSAKVNPAGIITTVAGNGLAIGSLEMALRQPALKSTLAVAVDTGGNLYISDPLNGRIRKVNTAGIISTVAVTWHTGSLRPAMAALPPALYCGAPAAWR
jgi:hypothetical protein